MPIGRPMLILMINENENAEIRVYSVPLTLATPYKQASFLGNDLVDEASPHILSFVVFLVYLFIITEKKTANTLRG